VRHTYDSQREKRLDFWLAFGGWIVVNGIAIAITSQLGTTAGPIAGGILLLANIVAPIVLAFTRSYVALGILTAFAAALSLVVGEGVFATIGDFIMAATSGFGTTNANPAPVIGALIVGAIVWLVAAFFALRAIHRGIR
jgi:hypothetical protein